MVTASVTSLPNSFWSRRICLTGFAPIVDPGQALNVFDNLEGHLRPPLNPILTTGRSFKLKVEMLFRVDIPQQNRFDVDFWFDLVPFEVGRHRHGQDGNGQPNLSNIVTEIRDRVAL